MIVVRIAKVIMIAALAAFALIVAYDNITDYGANYGFAKDLEHGYQPSPAAS